MTKADLFEDGLSGGVGSHALRISLLASLGLPRYLSANSMLDVINTMYSFDEYKGLLTQLQRTDER